MDRSYFVYYEKSKIDKNAIVALGIFAVRDYSLSYLDVQTKFLVKAVYVFQPGHAAMIKRNGYYCPDNKAMIPFEWEQKASIHSLITNEFTLPSDFKNHSYSRKSIAQAVEGTPFRWSGWEQYMCDRDMVTFFALFAKYPCVEYLMKLGFDGLVAGKLEKYATHNTVYWRGKNLFSVLKINKQDLAEIRANKLDISFSILKIFQQGRKDGSQLTITEASDLDSKYYPNHIDEMMKMGKIRTVINYLDKQMIKYPEHFEKRMGYTKELSAFQLYRDYLEDCKKLGLDLEVESIKYPTNLHQAHLHTIRQVKYKEDKKLNQKIQLRMGELDHYRYEDGELLIRPAEDSVELIIEGKSLHHCVGRYAESYARGELDLLVIRKISEPDKPYFTVEIRGNTILQCRGLKNCIAGEDVESFLAGFKVERLGKKKSRVKVTA